MKTVDKPFIIAICGKSATGKDTLAKRLVRELKDIGYDAGLIVSDTTRPARIGEQDGVDYNFISLHDFMQRKYKGQYLECAEFRGWMYGTSQSNINHLINVGVFNPQGLENLYFNARSRYDIIPVLLDEKIITRLKRSKEREGKFRLEHLRRAYTDYKDFKNFSVYSYFKQDCIYLAPKSSILNRMEQVIVELSKRGVL